MDQCTGNRHSLLLSAGNVASIFANRGIQTERHIGKIASQRTCSYGTINQLVCKIFSQGNIKHFRNISPTCAHFCMVAFNYARELAVVGQYKEAIEIAEEGKKVCLDYGHYLSLPGLLNVLAESYHFLGDDTKSKEYYYQTYYLGKVIGDEHNLQIIRDDAMKYLGIDFNH